MLKTLITFIIFIFPSVCFGDFEWKLITKTKKGFLTQNKQLIKKANNLLCIFSEYLCDSDLEEFFTDTNLTKKGKELLKEIEKELSKKEEK